VTSADKPSSYRPERPLRVGVLTNPRSLRNRRGLARVKQIIGQFPKVLHREAIEPAAVADVLQEFADAGVELLVFNSGDGTIGLGLGRLLEQQTFSSPPLLSLIRGGNTNMDAGDMGQPQSQGKALERVLTWAQADPRTTTSARILQRPVLKVRMGDDGPTHYGMFFGAGAIIKGIEYCHEAVHRKGLVDGLGPGVCTLRVLVSLGRGDPRFVTPVPMTLRPQPELADGIPADGDQDMLLVLVSTLERLFLGLTPYWGGGKGPLQLTTVRFHPAHPLRTLPGLMRGRTGRFATPENGYRSGRLDELELLMNGPITLDGEIHHAHRDRGPIRISNGGYARFVVV
jgi:hypothetical protein